MKKVEEDVERRARMDLRKERAIAASFVYLILIVIYVIAKLPTMEKSLDLNELGDFLAGVFGPLSFFWLVYGYFQQQEELMLNTEALRLQAEEMRIQSQELANQVQQHKELVEVNQKQYFHEKEQAEERKRTRQKEVEPHLMLIGDAARRVGVEWFEFVITIANIGKIAKNIRAETNDDHIKSFKTIHQLEETPAELKWGDSMIPDLAYDFWLGLKYCDIHGTEYTSQYTVTVDDEGETHIEQIEDSTLYGPPTEDAEL